MTEITTICLDLAKNVFQIHAVDATGTVVIRRQIRRAQMMLFFSRLAPCLIGTEACAGAHYWARELAKLGHEVRLIPPSYVKPFVKRCKTDAADAEAICTAVAQPTMRFVPIKTAVQQAMLMSHRTRDFLVRQLTQLANGRCCITLTSKDSHCESMRLDGMHEQAITRPLSHNELVQLHGFSAQARIVADLAGQGDDLARAA